RGSLVSQDPNDEPAASLLERINQAKQRQDSARSMSGRFSRALPEIDPTLACNVLPEPYANEPAGLKQNQTCAESDGSFIKLTCEAQVDAVWEILFGSGTIERKAAIRTAADTLRDQGLLHFQRIRRSGILYKAIEAALARGLHEGDFDR